MDIFVPVHFFGWWVKALMLRDYWLCHTLSILFEVMEYTLEHQVPNFAECWWDHVSVSTFKDMQERKLGKSFSRMPTVVKVFVELFTSTLNGIAASVWYVCLLRQSVYTMG